MQGPRFLDIRLDLTSPRAQQHLLLGLDQWLRLGLLSDTQVRLLGSSLSQRLPIPSEVVSPPDASQLGQRRSVPAATAAKPAATVPSPILRATRAFVAEMSVIWLLFLGVFLVVVSSAVLAVSQWSAFPPVGQYGILLIYTLGFWGASRWTARQEKLQATARMLAIATLLLFPINAWMIDALGLLSPSLGLILPGICLLGLSYVAVNLLADRPLQVPFILLGWLHLGWAYSDWPLVAIYLGTVGTTAYLAYRHRLPDLTITDSPITDRPITGTAQTGTPAPPPSSRLVVMLSLLMLLGRSVLLAEVPVQQLGLALGLCGTLLVWLAGHRLWTVAGGLLLFFGWAITVNQSPPWQALGVSGLALGLLGHRLWHHGRRGELLALVGVGVQAYWRLWYLLPAGWRMEVLQRLSALSPEPVTASAWAGIALIPTVAAVLWLAQALRHRQQPVLANLSATIALLLGGSLTILSASNPLTLAVNLTASTGLLLWQISVHARLLNLAHGVGLAALMAWIHIAAPDLNGFQWGYVGLVALTVEWGLSLCLRHRPWRQSTWQAGIGIAVLTYGAYCYGLGADWLLIVRDSPRTSATVAWLWVPIALTVVANHSRAIQPQRAVGLTMAALVAYTPFLLHGTWAANALPSPASFALGTVCMLLNSRRYGRDIIALFTVGSALAMLSTGWIWQTNTLSSSLLLVGAIEIVGLWTMQRWWATGNSTLARLYNRAMQGWSVLLLVMLYGGLSLITLVVYTWPWVAQGDLMRDSLAAAAIPLVGLVAALRQRSTNARWWSVAVGVGLIATLAVAAGTLPDRSPYPLLAVILLALGALAQWAGDGWVRQPQQPYLSSWHAIPILYGLGGWLINHVPLWDMHLWDVQAASALEADTGLYSWLAALIFIGVGRRQARWQGLCYVGLLGISLGAYELVIYRLLQASGGQPGDGLVLLAGLAGGLAVCDRTLARWLLPYLRISASGLQSVAHGHWLLGTLLVALAVPVGLSSTGSWLWMMVSLGLAGYVLALGNRRWTPTVTLMPHGSWTGLGLLEMLGVVAYARFELFPEFPFLLSWGGLIACVLGFGLYRLPWQQWGWPTRPWHWLGLGLPLLTLSVTLLQVKTQNLLLVGGFYAWVAQRQDSPPQGHSIRLSYLSVVLFNWAALRFLSDQGWLSMLWLGTLAGVSLLYMIEVEPQLQPPSLRSQRHALRLLGSSLIAITALYQTEVSQAVLVLSGVALVMGLGLMVAGTMLRVRAYLYTGIGLFIAQTLRVLWRLVSTDALLLWAIGIVLGLLFIWVAATFESRRTQVSDLLSEWSVVLDSWA